MNRWIREEAERMSRLERGAKPFDRTQHPLALIFLPAAVGLMSLVYSAGERLVDSGRGQYIIVGIGLIVGAAMLTWVRLRCRRVYTGASVTLSLCTAIIAFIQYGNETLLGAEPLLALLGIVFFLVEGVSNFRALRSSPQENA